MLNNYMDGLSTAPAGTLRASVYVGDTCLDSTQTTSGVVSTGKVGIENNYAKNHFR